MVYGVPIGLAAFNAGLGSQSGPQAFGNTFNAAFGAGGGGRGGDSYDKVLKVLELEQLLRSAQNDRADRQAEAAAAQQRQQDLNAFVGSFPEDQQARARAFPKVFAEEAAASAFPAPLTEDQRIDNDLALRRFNFEVAKYDREAEAKALERGRLDDVQSKFYIGEIGKADKAYNNYRSRYESGVRSLGAKTATGDKAAIVHLARMVSDEALQEADISRAVSTGVLPGYFENLWNSALGKGGLEDNQRREIRQQFGRELATRYGNYNHTYNRLEESFSPQVIETERRRVLGKQRELPPAVMRQVEFEQLAAEEEQALLQQQQAAEQQVIQQQEAQSLGQIMPGQVSLQQADGLTEQQLESLPIETIRSLLEQIQAQKAAAEQTQEQQAERTVNAITGQPPGPFR